MAQRTHLSPSRHIGRIEPASQNGRGSYEWKPRGFWYEVNGDWRRWLKGEGYLTYRIADRSTNKTPHVYLHRLRLNDCNVLKISSVKMLDAFDREYRINERSDTFGGFTFHDYNIDWPRLATEYDGIEIAPYFWERRLSVDVRWYYSWDCASGCIWTPKNATVSLVRQLV